MNTQITQRELYLFYFNELYLHMYMLNNLLNILNQ